MSDFSFMIRQNHLKNKQELIGCVFKGEEGLETNVLVIFLICPLFLFLI